MNNLSDGNTAAIRTAWSAAVIFALAYVVSKLTGHEVDTSDPTIIIWAGAIMGVLHRLFSVLAENVPWIGYVLFGINRSPGYTNPPPAVPVVAAPPPQGDAAPVDAGALSLQDILVISAIVIVGLFIFWVAVLN